MEKTIKNPFYQEGYTSTVVHQYPFLTTIPPGQLVELPPIPEGWEFAGVRVPNGGEPVLCEDGNVIKATRTGSGVVILCVCLKPKRWRADVGGKYWTIEYGNVINDEDGRAIDDNQRWNNGWYWRTREEAESVLDRMRKAVQS